RIVKQVADGCEEADESPGTPRYVPGLELPIHSLGADLAELPIELENPTGKDEPRVRSEVECSRRLAPANCTGVDYRLVQVLVEGLIDISHFPQISLTIWAQEGRSSSVIL